MSASLKKGHTTKANAISPAFTTDNVQAADKSRGEQGEERAMKEDSMKHGAFGWVELMTTDSAAARAFYSELFGWETEESPSEGMPYTVVKVGGEPVGGIMPKPPGCGAMPPAWSVYVTVDDVDATAEKVVQLGGKVLRPPMDIPDVGRFCVLQDPQGGTICAITYAASGQD
jgi:predicted enzyme related to lactoylglutathione lyase